MLATEFLNVMGQRSTVAVLRFAAIFVFSLALPANAVLAADSHRPVEQGVFLVADPMLNDPDFRKTVVFVWQHGVHGTQGIVINRPTSTKLSNVLPMVDAFKTLNMTVYVGGPVSRLLPILLFRHRGQPPIGQRVLGDVYISTNFDVLTESPDAPWSDWRFRVYSGYAGWAPGQLASEMTQGAWHVLRGDARYIFNPNPEDIWAKLFSASQAIQVYH